jgi:catalase
MPTQKKPASAVARTPSQSNTNQKVESLETFRSDATDQALTTNQGVKVSDNQNTLRAGTRGPSLLEDFIMREKITHFDHERIPERIVHARGAAAHGVFESYGTAKSVTKAGFLGKTGTKTDVFTRFSTMLGSRGSADTVRDTRGFAVKFECSAQLR